MKKAILFLLVGLLLTMAALPVLADEAVPSIERTPEIEIETITPGGNPSEPPYIPYSPQTNDIIGVLAVGAGVSALVVALTAKKHKH